MAEENEFASKLNKVERKWQDKWEQGKVHESEMDESREKCYVLDMFPYPSGKLHMGHGRAFSLGDAYSRFKMMQGYNVMHPMGWDAFGLPAENAAIDRDINPREWTYDCIDSMRDGFKRLGFSLDWSREVTTCDPEYYRWDQWIFLKMLEEGIAYRDEAEVNWCPGCETVLADEQVENGLCWRCDSVVEKRDMKQWKLGITEYADELLEDLEQLEGWPDKVRKMQNDWIGKSTGASIQFPLKGSDEEIEVFTTRPDTIYGATFMALAPEHPLAEQFAEENEEIADYIKEAKKRDAEEREEKNKNGVFTGQYAENPLNGEEIPVYVAEFVLMEYGTGAIMAVPAHDERDHEFATEHGIDIKPVIKADDHEFDEEAYEEDGEHFDSGEINGLENEEAIEKMIEILEERGLGEGDVNYRLRDWLISRQRYWGTPIPVVYCDDCGTVPVPEKDLPVELPEDVEFTGQGNPVETSDTFHETECPECGGTAERETDTMDTFINSSWYFLRYCSPDYDEGPFEVEEANYWMNVDQYVGGIEHAVMHLLYARFFNKFLRDQDMVENDEPFEKLLTQGMVNHPAYRCPEHGWLYPEEVDDGNTCSKCGRELEVQVMKMSKSKNNVVRPIEIVEDHGADTARTFILRAAGPTKELDWSKEGVESSERMIERVYRLITDNQELITGDEPDLDGANLNDRIVAARVQRAIQKSTEEAENYEFHMAIAEVDKLLTRLYWYIQREPDPAIFSHGVRTLVKLLAPYAPHITEELWQEELGGENFLVNENWPSVDEELLDEEAEEIDDYFNSVSSDIRELEDLVDGEPSKIRLIRAASWKYRSAEKILEQVERDSRDVGAVMGAVLDDELKQHAESVKNQAIQAVENPGKFEKQFLNEETEDAALEQNITRWSEEFDTEVEIETEEESSEDKASRAEPGRPAIVMR